MDDETSIQVKKLGHELLEIRVRALKNIISKLELGLLTSEQLLNQRDLFYYLVKWFKFPNPPCKGPVFELISSLVQTKDDAYLLLRHDPQLETLSKEAGNKYRQIVSQIKSIVGLDSVASVESATHSAAPSRSVDASQDEERALEVNDHYAVEASNTLEAARSSLVWESFGSFDNSSSAINSFNDSSVKPLYLKSSKLAESDAKILNTVSESLKDPSQFIRASSFFYTVLLHDFPPHVFLNNSSILKSLFEVLENSPNNAYTLRCFNGLTCSLLQYLNYCNSLDLSSPDYYGGTGETESSVINGQVTSQPGIGRRLVNDLGILSVGDYCGLVLDKIGPSVTGLVELLSQCVGDPEKFWNTRSDCIGPLKHCIISSLSTLAQCVLRDKLSNPIDKLLAQNNIVRLLTNLIPVSISPVLIPPDLQEAIYYSLLDSTVILLYPAITKELFTYFSCFKFKSDVMYEDFKCISSSLKSGASFARDSCFEATTSIELFKDALDGLEFHQQYQMIQKFTEIVLKGHPLNESDLEQSIDIILRLLAHSDSKIKMTTYKKLSDILSNYLGPEKCITSTNPLPALAFILNEKVFHEILSHGMSDEENEIRSSSENILMLAIKCQLMIPSTSWRQLLAEFIPVFPLLHVFADDNSNLGRAILMSLDPDKAKSIQMNSLELLKGNIRLMLLKNTNAREEGKARIVYLLKIPSHLESVLKLSLPGTSTPTHSPGLLHYEEGSLKRVIEVLMSRTNDKPLLKTAVTQLSLMIEDHSLHVTFLESGGLDAVRPYFEDSIKKTDDFSKHFFSNILVVYKNLARQSAPIRHDFSQDYSLISTVLQGLFLLELDWRVQRDAAQLLSLIVFASGLLTTYDYISFPSVILERASLPFDARKHENVSESSSRSKKDLFLNNKKVRKSLSVQWCVYSTKGGLDKIATWDGISSNKSPTLLPVSAADLNDLLACHVTYNLKKHLKSLAKASSLDEADKSIGVMHRFIRLVTVADCVKKADALPWLESFRRYFAITPAGGSDQALFCEILRFLSALSGVLPRQISWISELIEDRSMNVNALLPQVLLSGSSDAEKEMSRDLLLLIEICIDKSSDKKWDFVIKSLIQSLAQSHTQKFYSLAVLCKVVCCLLKLSEKKLQFETKYLWKIFNAFHCSSPDSYMGLTVTRLTLVCLSISMPRTSQIHRVSIMSEIKNFETILKCGDFIVKSAAFELLSGLCCDGCSTDTILNHIPNLRSSTLSSMLNENEPCIVREQAAILYSNLIHHSFGEDFTNDPSMFFKAVAGFVGRYGVHMNEAFNLAVPFTSGLLTAFCRVVVNFMAKDKDSAISEAKSQGLIAQLFRQMAQWQNSEPIQSQKVVDMYEAVCRVLIHCTGIPGNSVVECTPVLVWLLQDSSYAQNLCKKGLFAESMLMLGSIVCNHPSVSVIFTEEAVKTVCSSLNSSEEYLVNATTSALPQLTSFLPSDACVDIIKVLGECIDSKRFILASIVRESKVGTATALEHNLLQPIINRLKETHVKLAVLPTDIPRNKKANTILYSLSIDLGLVTNFLAGSNDAKEMCVTLGLADVIHKLWAWCLLDVSLVCSLLQALITFTANCPSAASTLVMTSTMTGVGQRKTPTSNSVLHAVIGLISKDIYGMDVKRRIFDLMKHACQAQESRSVLNKPTILNEFFKLYDTKRNNYVDEMETLWLDYFKTFSFYPDGQATLIKSEEVLDQLIRCLSSGRQTLKPLATSIIRNIALNPINKQRVAVLEKLLKALSDRCTEPNLSPVELKDLLVIVWYLTANSQRGKYSVKSVSLDSRLHLAVSPHLKNNADLAQLAESVFAIVRS